MTGSQAIQYSVHPAVGRAITILDNLPTTTGRSLEDWIALLRQEGPSGTKERKGWLKTVHKLGATTASMIVERAEGRGAEDTDPDAYLVAAARHVEAMFAGAKAALRPMHDLLIEQALQRHEDVTISPCRTIVPLYRNHVIAQIKPSTRTRLDFGLALKGTTRKPSRRLIATGGLEKGDRITHRIPLADRSGIDDELWSWFEVAYSLDA